MPIYVFAIGGQAGVYSTHDLAAVGVLGDLPDYEPWLKVPQGATQSIDVQGGTSSIGELQCEVVDQGGAVRMLVGTTTLEGQSATLTVGYPGMQYSEFVVLHVYVLYKVIPSANYTSWFFRARDVQTDAKRTIWDNPINGAPISDANPWVLQGTPCEIVQTIWVLGLGHTLDTIDRAGMVALDSAAEGLFCSARPFLFRQTKPFAAKAFLEQQIYKASGLYPVVNNVGQLSLKAFRAPAAGAATVFAFTADNTIGLPEIDRAPILNDMKFGIDYDGSEQNTTLLFLDATSISTFSRSNELELQSEGLRTELGAQWWCQEVASRMFRRFAGTTGLRGGAPIITVKAFYSTLRVWVGDYVTLSHPKMPDLFTGALGVTDRVMEVIDRSPDYASGRMTYKLLDTGLTGASPAARFGTAVIGAATLY